MSQGTQSSLVTVNVQAPSPSRESVFDDSARIPEALDFEAGDELHLGAFRLEEGEEPVERAIEEVAGMIEKSQSAVSKLFTKDGPSKVELQLRVGVRVEGGLLRIVRLKGDAELTFKATWENR